MGTTSDQRDELAKALKDAIDIFKRYTDEWLEDAAESMKSCGEVEQTTVLEDYLRNPDDYWERKNFIDEGSK